MVLTQELLDSGKSSNNGWNLQQLQQLGIEKLYKGWKHDILYKEFSDAAIAGFLSLKDSHFKSKLERGDTVREKTKRRMGILTFTPTPEDMPYKEQYLHPNWQRMRLFVFDRDKYRCVNCGTYSKTLHAHHIKYLKGKKVWEVPVWYIVSLCEDCHSEEYGRDLTIK